jgi:hypothetical protein
MNPMGDRHNTSVRKSEMGGGPRRRGLVRSPGTNKALKIRDRYLGWCYVPFHATPPDSPLPIHS